MAQARPRAACAKTKRKQQSILQNESHRVGAIDRPTLERVQVQTGQQAGDGELDSTRTLRRNRASETSAGAAKMLPFDTCLDELT